MSETNPSISEILKNVDKQIDQDIAFVLAGGVNVYIDALARIGGKTLIGPDDIYNILTIWRTLLSTSALTPNSEQKHAEMEQVTGAPNRPRVRVT